MKRILAIFLGLLLIAQPAFAVVDPVGWWQLDDGSGTNAADSGSGTNAGTLINTPTWVSGQVGSGALSFSAGSSQYVTLGTPAALDITGNISITAWINPTTLPTSNGEIFAIVSKGYTSGSDTAQYILRFVQDSGTVYLQCGTYNAGTIGVLYAYGGAITTGGGWYNIACLYNGTAWKLYIAGSEVDSVNGSSPQSSSEPIIIGGTIDDGSPSQYFDGEIDDVRIYNRAITPTEITDMANQTESAGGTGVRRRVIVVD